MHKQQATYVEEKTITMSDTAIRRALGESAQQQEDDPSWVTAAWIMTHLACVAIGWLAHLIYSL